jgi:hypothetical protein
MISMPSPWRQRRDAPLGSPRRSAHTLSSKRKIPTTSTPWVPASSWGGSSAPPRSSRHAACSGHMRLSSWLLDAGSGIEPRASAEVPDHRRRSPSRRAAPPVRHGT